VIKEVQKVSRKQGRSEKTQEKLIEANNSEESSQNVKLSKEFCTLLGKSYPSDERCP